MTPVTFDESLTKKCECLHRNVPKSMKLICYVPTMSQYILNVMVADYCSIFFCKCATNVVGLNGDFIF